MNSLICIMVVQILCLIVLVLCTIAFPVMVYVLLELKIASNKGFLAIFFLGLLANAVMMAATILVLISNF